MRAEGARLAFFESTTLLAKEIRALLEARGFPAVGVKMFDTREEGAVTEFGGEAMVVVKPDVDTLVDLDVAFLCGSAAQSAPFLEWSRQKGYVAIDLSGASRGVPGVPLIHCDLNLDELSPGGNTPPLVGAPHPVSHNLATVASAAHAASPIASMEAVALRPASELGEPGVDELYQQTLGLLNFGAVPQETFGRQLAFNLLPSAGLVQSRAEAFDQRAQAETTRMLGFQPAQVSVTSAFIPLFHGHAISVALNFERPPEIGGLIEALTSTRGLNVIDDPSAASPVELAGEDSLAQRP